MADRNVTFDMFMFEDRPNEFFLVRNVNDWSTHWLNAEGEWIPVPEDDGEGRLDDFFQNTLKSPGVLPKFTMFVESNDD